MAGYSLLFALAMLHRRRGNDRLIHARVYVLDVGAWSMLVNQLIVDWLNWLLDML